MKLRDLSLRYLTYRDRTEEEMRRYLRRKGFAAEETEAEIEALRELRLLDDVRFARQYLAASFARGRGLLRVRRELRQKGVGAFEIEDGEAAYEEEYGCSLAEEEPRRARQAAEAFLSGSGKIDPKQLARLGRRLAGLGYESRIIYDILGSYRRREEL
ncbi:MAG: regulatory protein RecX [Anaerovoracaceae bacterium]|jgi:regulatory protein